VLGNYMAMGNRLMLRLHDGSVVEGKADINVNDSITIEKGKIASHLKMGAGAHCRVIDGAHVGTSGEIKELIAGGMNRPSAVTVAQKDGGTFQTPVRNIMVTK